MQNIEGGVRYLKFLLEKFDGNVDLSLAAYNAGENLVERLGRVPRLRKPETTSERSSYLQAKLVSSGAERRDRVADSPESVRRNQIISERSMSAASSTSQISDPRTDGDYKTSAAHPARPFSFRAPLRLAQSTLSQQASAAFLDSAEARSRLNEKPPAERTRADYLKVINAYERVYLITPHTGYADNALITMARLYEEIKDTRQRSEDPAVSCFVNIRRLRFGTLRKRDIARLERQPSEIEPRKDAAVDNIRYWEETNSVRVVVDVSGDVTLQARRSEDLRTASSSMSRRPD